ncbi:hypothetical protein B0A49_13270, partial [Cryomyces minteri]
RRTIKKLELNLERDILCYKHAAASTLEKSASQARIFDQNERSTLNKSVLKHGTQGWNGVEPHSTDVRTCDLEIPRGHATVKCGKYFEVRYFLNIAPRLQSLERMRAEADEMQQLGYMLDASPRKGKMTIRKVPSGGLSGIGVGSSGFAVEYQYHTPPSNRKGRVFFDGADANVEEVRRRLRTMRSFESGLSKRSGKTSKSQAS